MSKHKYGEPPKIIRIVPKIKCTEMMFYQYLPIKIADRCFGGYEKRLHCFWELISLSISNFRERFGEQKYKDSYIYLTVRHLYQEKESSFNRRGYHSDGFMTDDINYIWSDCLPTVFNTTEFNLTLNDTISLKEMEQQALKTRETVAPNYALLRLNQFNIHKVSEEPADRIRTFFKLSFSTDKYNLIGNSHNYEIDYKWVMKKRNKKRNIPQKKSKRCLKPLPLSNISS